MNCCEISETTPKIFVERKMVNGKIINTVNAKNCNIIMWGQEIFIEGRPLNSYIEESKILYEQDKYDVYDTCEEIELETPRHHNEENEKLLKYKNEIRYNQIRNRIIEHRQKIKQA
jgi:hypothetical protein